MVYKDIVVYPDESSTTKPAAAWFDIILQTAAYKLRVDAKISHEVTTLCQHHSSDRYLSSRALRFPV